MLSFYNVYNVLPIYLNARQLDFTAVLGSDEKGK